ncbi:MAG: class I SAM-dependent methyltransferase [Rhodospirillales bacterium]|jgi:predicted O-methyltransferase YrrM|nr:class I SAM-dependent methyltransferase [Rhodospirillales bacterium]
MFGRLKTLAGPGRKGSAGRAAAMRQAEYGGDAPRNPALCHAAPAGETEWYPPVMIGAKALARRIVGSATYVREARALLHRLDPDAYADYVKRYYDAGLDRFGDGWGFADIVTVLMGLGDALRPRRYLEIGVRRGRSVCAVASRMPGVELVMFDLWIANYAGMENPGPHVVERELDKLGHTGRRTFVDGDSHVTVPEYFRANPDVYFDLITVDGDHTERGAVDDLCDVLPHLTVGGAVVFDDVCHPRHMGLRDVWERVVCDDRRFSAWTYDDVGYRVGFANRKW